MAVRPRSFLFWSKLSPSYSLPRACLAACAAKHFRIRICADEPLLSGACRVTEEMLVTTILVLLALSGVAARCQYTPDGGDANGHVVAP